MQKLLEGGRFFTVRSKKSGQLCIATLISDSAQDEIQSYQVVRYKDQKVKWVSYDELLKDFDPIDVDPKPCPIRWISPDYKTRAESDECFQQLLKKKASDINSVQTNAQIRSKSA
ncbi:hypothetical protein AB3N59_20425 (plasmid) [Leptospira sp. WS92.C1]